MPRKRPPKTPSQKKISTARPVERETLTLPQSIAHRASQDSLNGIRICIPPNLIIGAMTRADAALNGNSNDAEHDALQELRETLSEWYEDASNRHNDPEAIERAREILNRFKVPHGG